MRPTNGELAQQGIPHGHRYVAWRWRISYIFEFAKIGWSVSAVGSVVRFDQDMSRKRALARLLGTLGRSPHRRVPARQAGFDQRPRAHRRPVFAVLNGLYKKAKVGQMPLFYTATILILYSLNDIKSGKDLRHAAARLQPRRHRRRRVRGPVSVPVRDELAAAEGRRHADRRRLTRS